jgi:hypothetical protein
LQGQSHCGMESPTPSSGKLDYMLYTMTEPIRYNLIVTIAAFYRALGADFWLDVFT